MVRTGLAEPLGDELTGDELSVNHSIRGGKAAMTYTVAMFVLTVQK